MGVLIQSTEQSNIVIKGTEIELPNVYGRIEFAGRADGKTMEIAVTTYASKEAFKQDASVLTTNVAQGSIVVELEDNESQSLDTALAYVQNAYSQLNFDTEII